MTDVLIGDADGVRRVNITGGIEINPKPEPCQHRFTSDRFLRIEDECMLVGDYCHQCGKQRVTGRVKIEAVEGGVWE